MQLRQLQESWQSCSPEVRNDYGEEYYESFYNNVHRYITTMTSDNTWQVQNCLEHAILSEHPYTRYVPGYIMSILSSMFGVMPNVFQDVCIALAMKTAVSPSYMKRR